MKQLPDVSSVTLLIVGVLTEGRSLEGPGLRGDLVRDIYTRSTAKDFSLRVPSQDVIVTVWKSSPLERPLFPPPHHHFKQPPPLSPPGTKPDPLPSLSSAQFESQAPIEFIVSSSMKSSDLVENFMVILSTYKIFDPVGICQQHSAMSLLSLAPSVNLLAKPTINGAVVYRCWRGIDEFEQNRVTAYDGLH